MKKFIKSLLPVEIVREIVEYKYNNFPNGIIKNWIAQGSPVPPPPVVKQKMVRETQREYNLQVLVETGTYLGYMVSSQRKNFEMIYSIELSEELFARAARKFRKYSNIKIIQGDSGQKMAEVTKRLTQQTLFWLDGHYSGGITAKGNLNCPIWAELDSIFKNASNHIILIDDAREFNGTNDYPSFEEVKSYFKKKNPAYNVFIKDDVIFAKL